MNSIMAMRFSSLSYILFYLASIVLVSMPGLSHAAAQESEKTGKELHSVAYLTLRNVSGDPDPEDRFGDERDLMRAGQCIFSHASLSLLKPLSRNGLIYIPDNWNQLESVTEVDELDFWAGIEENAGGQRPLLYLHGYNTSFTKACDQAALFQAKLKLEQRLILFSWPSDGALLNYARDESDLYWSVAPLERVLQHMVEQFGPGGFDVVAHSLGARGLFVALVQLAHRHHDAIPLLNQLVLTAPDIDAGIFQQYLAEIRPLVENISLYGSDNDRPLALSEEVHGYPRLGQTGSQLENLQGIEIIDISKVGVRSFSGHLYHLYQGSVVQDLDLLLNRGFKAGQRDTLIAVDENHWQLREMEADQ